MKRPTAPRISTILLRVLIAVLAALAGVIALMPERVRALIPKPEVEVFHVAARARAIADESPGGRSLTDTYYVGRTASAHLHLIGKDSGCELHLHEHTEEASIPVTGRPLVTEVFARAGSRVTRTAGYDTGTLIVSRPNGAHAWRNPSHREYQATLVLTLGGEFPGNDFVRPTDARILKAEEPLILDPKTDERISGRDRGNRELVVPAAHAALTVLALSEPRSVEPGGEATLLYVVEGAGLFDAGKRSFLLRPTTLVVSRLTHTARIVPDAETRLVGYLVRTPR